LIKGAAVGASAAGAFFGIEDEEFKRCKLMSLLVVRVIHSLAQVEP
jgi:hypothetical protein